MSILYFRQCHGNNALCLRERLEMMQISAIQLSFSAPKLDRNIEKGMGGKSFGEEETSFELHTF